MTTVINDLILRTLPTGSLAALFVLYGVGTSSAKTRAEIAWSDQCLSANLDGPTDIRTIFMCNTTGTGVFDPQSTRVTSLMPVVNVEESDVAELPHLLRRQTGLTIETLAKALGVSKVTYHNWLNGAGISEESRARLFEVRDLLADVVTMKPDLRAFLSTPTPVGSPLELLSQRRDVLVVGLASRGDALFADPQPSSIEGLRRVRPIAWAQSVDRDRLEELSPSPSSQEEAIVPHEEGEPFSVGYVLFRA